MQVLITMKTKNSKNLIMFIGKTHSGKTTLAKEIERKNNKVIVLEADPISLFIRNNFPKLRELDFKEHKNNFKDISLKYRLFLILLEFVMDSDRPIILSNSNMYQKGRQLIFKLAKKFNYNVIGIYFDFSEKILFDRIKESGRTTKVLRVSKNFNELIINQRSRMEIPNAKDFKEFFIIKSKADRENIKNKLIKILK